MDRVIFHVDCNGFYAAVECLDDPSLKEIPMAVAGDPKDRSGIILAKNDLAKHYGVKTAETIYQARRKCPGLKLVPPRRERYHEVSRAVKALFEEYTDQVESFGLDEAWLDVTGSLGYFNAGPLELADRVRAHVKREIGITVSVGVSFNKVFAKLGSDMKKPDATTVIRREDMERLVWPLPAGALLYVGHAAAEVLERHMLRTIGDVVRYDRAALARLLGKGGDQLWRYANGLDNDPVRRACEREPVKSVGNGMTFRRDLRGWDELKAGVIALSDEVAVRLRLEGMKCCAVQVSIKDPALKTISRQARLDAPTHLQKELVEAAMAILRANWRENAPVRALTITAISLTPKDQAQEQLCLWQTQESARRERLERLESAVQRIRGRHGAASIAMGMVESDELGIRRLGKKRPAAQETSSTGGEKANFPP